MYFCQNPMAAASLMYQGGRLEIVGRGRLEDEVRGRLVDEMGLLLRYLQERDQEKIMARRIEQQPKERRLECYVGYAFDSCSVCSPSSQMAVNPQHT